MNYPQSTRERVADIKNGVLVETGTLANSTYLLTGGTQTEIFTVKGLIKVHELYLEFLTACSAHATQVLFNCTFTTPSVAANAMCAKCAAITSLGQGGRVVWLGGAVATAAVITDSPGLSDVLPSAGQLVGGVGFIGSIGILASDASQASGTFKASILYTPRTVGAYVEALL